MLSGQHAIGLAGHWVSSLLYTSHISKRQKLKLKKLVYFSPCHLSITDFIYLCPLQVISWIIFTGLFSYLKVVIGTLLHEAGHAALLWCGISIQAGSLIGALTMFPLVNIYHVFARAQECVDNCS